MDYPEDDPIECTPDGEEVVGRVLQCSAPGGSALPPPSFLFADPTIPLPFLTVLLKPVADPSSGSSVETVRVKLWGHWSDRLSEIIKRDVKLTLLGATVMHNPNAHVGERTTLELPPSGAPAHASVHVDDGAHRTEVTAGGIRKRPLGPGPLRAPAPPLTMAPAAAPAAVPAAAPAAAPAVMGAGSGTAGASGAANDSAARPGALAQPAPKRQKGTAYNYHRLADLPDHTGVGGAPKEVHVFGVVLEYSLPCVTRGSDMKSVLHLVDESSAGPHDAIVVNFFKVHPTPPGVG